MTIHSATPMPEQSPNRRVTENQVVCIPHLGRMTQGTIFCGGHAEGYAGVPVWGIVITARCDALHDKTPIINYIPLVRVEDWLLRQGAEIILGRALKENTNNFKNLLSNHGLSHSLMEVHQLDDIVRTFFPVPKQIQSKKDEKESKDASLAQKLAATITFYIQIQTKMDKRNIRDEILRQESITKGLLSELISHVLTGYYYIQEIGTLTDLPSKDGYVAILREIHHIPQNIVKLIPEGLSKAEEPSSEYEGISFDTFDFICPVCEIQSPWIEHLMQTFCNVFAKIGIKDPDRTKTESIFKSLASTHAGKE